MKNQTNVLSDKLSALAANLPSLATVSSGYAYREAVAAFWADCQSAVNTAMPVPRVCGAGSGLYINHGRALTPDGILADGETARHQWLDYARAVAKAAGAVPALAGVENALAQKCGPAALSA
jgi:hypothetical protein